MRILQICSAREIGGGERYLADLSNSLARRGHDVFFALAPDADLKKELSEIPESNILQAKMRNAFDFRDSSKIADFIRKNKIEMIHAHLARDYPLAAFAAKKSETPFVLTRHVLFPLNKLHKFTLKNVSGIVAPSNAIKGSLENQNIFPPEKIKLIHYGIDIKHFAPAEKTAHENFTVGTIGHLAPIKGHDVFVRAAEIVSKKYPEIRFVIVGEDKSHDGENRREIEDLIAKLNLTDKIELTGWTDDVRPFLQTFDLFVSAARAEAFGLVMPEAMLNEIPTIAARSEGAVEIIKDETSGILVPNEDHERLAEKILDLFTDSKKRERIGIAGRKRVEKHFSLERMVAATEEFYRTILRK